MWSARLSGNGGGNAWIEVAGPLTICVMSILAAGVLLKISNSRYRAARECIRLQRGLEGLGPYLEPLPAPAQHLIRAMMTQTLFPRLLEDDDPVRQVPWPPATQLLDFVHHTSATRGSSRSPSLPSDPPSS
jgi:hypothetical protein